MVGSTIALTAPLSCRGVPFASTRTVGVSPGTKAGNLFQGDFKVNTTDTIMMRVMQIMSRGNQPGLPDVRQAWRAAPCLALSTGRRKPTGK